MTRQLSAAFVVAVACVGPARASGHSPAQGPEAVRKTTADASAASVAGAARIPAASEAFVEPNRVRIPKVSRPPQTMLALLMGAVIGAAASAQQPPSPAPSSPQTAPRCRVRGRVMSANTPLPGVSLAVHVGDMLKAATSTDIDGTYTILFAPNATYHLSADFTGFVGAGRDVVLGAVPCDQTVDFHLSLKTRDAVPTEVAAAAEPADASVPPATSTPDADPTRRGGGGGGQTAAAGGRRSAQTSGAGGRFQRLDVQADTTGAAALDVTPAPETDDVTRHLPSGFSVESVQGDAVAITGNDASTNLDRELMNDRLQMINLDQLDPATGQFAAGFGSLDPGFLQPGGRRAFVIGGRGARGQRPYQGNATYTFGGSILDSPPFQLRRDVPVTQPQFAQNTVGGTFGGFLKVPGLYANANRRTNVQVNYIASGTNNVFDQYATVPTDAERSGNFSSSSIQLIDPATSGQPFPGNQIPASRIDPGAATLMRFIPRPNLPGTTQNYHLSTTAHSSSESVSLRLTQNLSRTAAS